MSSDHGARTGASLETATEAETSDEQRVYLDDGRQVAITRDGGRQAVEIRAASGQLELRIKLTEDGPVLVLDGVKVELSATSVDVACDTFNVHAREAATITSAGTAAVRATEQVDVESAADVVVVGKHIRLN